MNNEDRQSVFTAQRYYYQMRRLFVAFIMLAAFTASADDLGDLKAAARRYVGSMKAVLALADAPDFSEAIAKAGEYAAAKIAYYDAARQAMPILLQSAKGQKTDKGYGKELTEIFHGYGEDKDQMATTILEAQLDRCPSSEKRDAALVATKRARQIAEQFVKDFLADSMGFDGATGILSTQLQ